MSSLVGNAIVSKAKSIFGKRLKAAEYEELVKMKSVSDIASYLRNHPNFRDTLSDIQSESIHRGQLETLIKKNAFLHTLRLIKFVQVKDAEFYRLNLVKREIDILLEILRSMISESFDSQISDMPYYMQQHTCYDDEKVSQAKTIDELIVSLGNCPYATVLKPFAGVKNHDIDYVAIEHALEIYYYDQAFLRIRQNYSGRTRKDLETIYLSRIELENIVKIYRLKKFYKADFTTIKTSLIHQYSRINEKKLDELIAIEDPDAILKYLGSSDLRKYSDDMDYVYVEYYVEKINYNLAKRYMYFTTSVPKVYAAFLILTEIETENLTNIIEGIRYGLSDIEIKKMLII